MPVKSLGLAVALAALTLTPAAAAPREMIVQQDTFGSVPLLAPQGEPKAFVIYLFDGELTPERRAQAEAIVSEGAAVVPLSAQAVIRQMDEKAEPDDDCLYALGEFEDLSTTAQRALGSASYRWPSILGDGVASGALAYLSIAQAPANTAAGAVSIGFTAQLASRLPFCPGAKGSPVSGGFSYAPATNIPGPWVLITPVEPDPATRAFVDADGGNETQVVAGDDAARFRAGLQAALRMGSPPTEGLGDLPLVDLPAQGRNSAFAVFLSGDGGWRDIDKSIAETLSKNGMSVVGLDSLRYFWKRKDPDRIAADLERIVAAYEQRWQAQRVLLIGFSMGADVIPPVWNKLSKATRDKIKLVVLMGLEPTAAYEISIAGYLGVSSDEVDIKNDLKTLPADRVMCFYGTEEKADGDTACTLPELAGATLLERGGGHHLDGNYEAIAADILARAKALK
ncbi:virulence factor family protein [Microvirga pudoricolor]|uniref:virulence factor family protein n=1 Tax=Microvirga pudoricolor TaxID=2778729 RepID=UPI00194EE17F|nr:virulence factor family protein [Microvirga pudoricolor]MBM6593340.1 virulence factor family protein [Microvirga pudoricolor]